MSLTKRELRTGAVRFADFAKNALDQKRRAGVCEVLRAAVAAMDAWGSFLWQLSEELDEPGQEVKGSLFVLAEWFPNNKRWSFERLETESIAGKVALTGRPEAVANALQNAHVGSKFKWWMEENRIEALCAVPVVLADAARATLAFYRQENRAFKPNEVERAMQIAGLFPGLYRSIRNEVSFTLLRRIEAQTVEDHPTGAETVVRVLGAVCEEIGETFACAETSIFLENWVEEPGIFRQFATTWPQDEARQTQLYRQGDVGITPWILQTGKAVRFFNMARLTPGRPVDPVRYPGMIWQDPLNIRETAVPQGTERSEFRPISYMATPILVRGVVRGAIRCCKALDSPYYFAEAELGLLKIASVLVGHYWETWMRACETEQERTSRDALLVGDLSRLNDALAVELNTASPNVDRIVQECIACGTRQKRTLPGADSRVTLLQQQADMYAGIGNLVRERLQHEAQQREFYVDLFHQLKSPVFVASATAADAMLAWATDPNPRRRLQVIRNQLSKIERVTRMVELFARLSAGLEPQPELATLDQARVFTTLCHEAEDYQLLSEPKRVKFQVERHGLSALQSYLVTADFKLLMVALSNLIDNAAKYSFPDTTVRIFSGLTGKGKFHVSVASSGFNLKPGEASECVKKRWRSDEARSVTGEGMGLGLWVVDHIMRAHPGGDLLIISPNPANEFEAKLLFVAARR
jgi:signal transduction histidine kinase